MRWLWMILLAILGVSVPLAPYPQAAEFVVYNVFRPLDMGFSTEPPPKDYFVNMGTASGVKVGTVLSVYRRTATYDLLSEKLYKEVVFPIARIKVIHAEGGTAIARMEKMNAAESTPGMSTAAIMIGDLVRTGDM